MDSKVVNELRKDFPIFENNKDLVYLDSAATSQMPSEVLKSITDFIEKENSNISRGLYALAENAGVRYDYSRGVVADFVGANKNEIVFTGGTTDSLNLISGFIDSLVEDGRDEIVLSEMEHHSNLVPWQQLAKRKGWKLKFIEVKDDFTLDMKDAKEKIGSKTAVVSVTHISNILGTINDVESLVDFAKSNGAISIIDAAQSVPHMKIDVKKIGCDFLAFSSHKMVGPMGVGVLYGKKELLNRVDPSRYGGGMVKKVCYNDSTFADSPEKFEAGTQNISGVIGLGSSIKYLNYIGLENIESWEKELLRYTLEKIEDIDGAVVYNPGISKSSGIISFNIEGAHPHDVASMLSGENIAIRAGHGCAMPLVKKLGLAGVCRVSFYFYNTFEDADKFISTIKKIKKRFD